MRKDPKKPRKDILVLETANNGDLEFKLTEKEIHFFESLDRAYEQGFISRKQYDVEKKIKVREIIISRDAANHEMFQDRKEIKNEKKISIILQ